MAIKQVMMRPIVGVLGGSKSDFPILEKAVAMLNGLGIANELLVVSAHRTPDRLFAYAEQAPERGIQVIIAGAGGAAHLPGMLAAKTLLPVTCFDRRSTCRSIRPNERPLENDSTIAVPEAMFAMPL